MPNNHVELRVMIPRELADQMQRHLAKHGVRKPAFVRQALRSAMGKPGGVITQNPQNTVDFQ